MAKPLYPTTTADGNAKHNDHDFFKDLLSLIAFIILFALIPCVSLGLRVLQPSPPQFRLNSSSLSILNVTTNNDTTANYDVTFSVKNPNKHDMFFEDIKASVHSEKESLLNTTLTDPNKLDMFFEEIKASVLSEKESLLNTTLTPFKVGAKNQTTIQTRFASLLWVHVDGCNVNNSGLNGPCGAANLSVELKIKATYEGFTWPIKKDVIKVECGSNVTTPVFGSRECSVRGRWKTIRNRSLGIFIISAILLFILAVVV